MQPPQVFPPPFFLFLVNALDVRTRLSSPAGSLCISTPQRAPPSCQLPILSCFMVVSSHLVRDHASDLALGYIHRLTGGMDLSVSTGLPGEGGQATVCRDSCCSGSVGGSAHRESERPINSRGADEAEATAAAAGWDAECRMRSKKFCQHAKEEKKLLRQHLAERKKKTH